MFNYPKLTIVTPSFNQGQFIEQTIDSVVAQDYPNLEYIVIDGGSTDQTLEILKRRSSSITLTVVEKDRGACDAIVKGLMLGTGVWFNWLNSDDILLPGALHTLARISEISPNAKWISGGRLNLSADGFPTGVCIPWRTNASQIATTDYFFPQDATFIKRAFLLENRNALNIELRNVFDTYLYQQLVRVEPPVLTTAIFSAMRWHNGQLTANSSNLRHEQDLIANRIGPVDLIGRMASRASRTRFHAEIISLINMMIVRGYWPEQKKWRIAEFNESSQNWFETTIPEFFGRNRY